MSDSEQSVRVEAISIKGLFGLYDHDIRLNTAARVTILHGPNGVGKSVLLRLIAAFFDGRYREFIVVPFTTFTVSLTDGRTATVYGLSEANHGSAARSLRLIVNNTGSQQLTYEIPIRTTFDDIAKRIEGESPFLSRMGESQFYEHRTRQMLTSEQVVERYGTASDVMAAIKLPLDDEPDVVKGMRDAIPVQLVETQRLLRTPRDALYRTERKSMIATVRSYSDELVGEISRTLSRYGTESQKLDQTFPQRLIWSGYVSTPTVEDLKERLNKLDEQLSKLNALGLIDKVSYPAQPSEIDALEEVKRSVMALYVQDTENKLQFLASLATRIQLLVDSVNGKFRNKTLMVSRERGLQVFDQRKRPVGLDALSSGEQHELVLWFDLLFNVKTNSLVLIDEPELSLHVSWQKKMLPELLEIAGTVRFDALVATHSPFIIGDRLDLTVSLDADIDE
jgi:predicted ATP-binding protein involved in virulence